MVHRFIATATTLAIFGPNLALYVDSLAGSPETTASGTSRSGRSWQFGVGVVGRAAGIDVHARDRLGLADPSTSRLRVATPGFTGHEEPLPDPWLAARISTEPVDHALLGSGGFIQPIDVSPPGSFDHETEVAREVLGREPPRELREATRAPLTLELGWTTSPAPPA